jgi:hypothetical protein
LRCSNDTKVWTSQRQSACRSYPLMPIWPQVRLLVNSCTGLAGPDETVNKSARQRWQRSGMPVSQHHDNGGGAGAKPIFIPVGIIPELENRCWRGVARLKVNCDLAPRTVPRSKCRIALGKNRYSFYSCGRGGGRAPRSVSKLHSALWLSTEPSLVVDIVPSGSHRPKRIGHKLKRQMARAVESAS